MSEYENEYCDTRCSQLSLDTVTPYRCCCLKYRQELYLPRRKASKDLWLRCKECFERASNKGESDG